ncbi:FAD-dependent oxidoreductase [Parapedobacter koreensis]|uniref:FAD dependent oxidoreductase n=1 Tax=Parapedobacter koreensis TaxID=332977 RepID=A0A1H7RPL5_9SPHI|nr:FAD-dependent oxidoreductase [Parapedobacter koreensis]SEL62181.1 FAD dependent oxidoreductase [Parapedobacter koreensis]
MNKLHITLLLLIAPLWGMSQSKRPQVLVYGYGADAYAAAIQSAMSNLNTVWVVNGDKMMPELTSDMIAVTSNANLDAGVWASLLARTLRHDKPGDSLSSVAKRRINPRIVQNILDSVIKANQNLTIVEQGQLRSVKKSGKDWQVELADRSRFKVRAVVDASVDAYLYQLAKGNTDSITTRTTIADNYFQVGAYEGLSRTGVVVGDLGGRSFTLPLASLIPPDNSNLYLTHRLPAVQRLLSGTADDIPLLMHVGQAVGAAAAYTAFFKTTSDKLDSRNVQGELLQYGARLIPFGDVPIEDPHFAAVQRVGATGMLLGRMEGDGRLYFDADKPVTASEIKPVSNQLFSRSQIWFVDHADIDTLTLADLFSYIKFVGQRGNELEGQVQKNWKRRFQLEGEYDENMLATRRLVTVLLDAYCKPFDVKIGLDGAIQR